MANNSTHELQKKYINYHTLKLRKLCEGHLRSNIDYVTTATLKNNKVVLHTVMQYKIYKVDNSYQKIRHVFNQSSSKLISLSITNSEKKVYRFPQNLLSVEKISQNQNDNEIAYMNTVEIPSQLKGEDVLTVKSVVEEYGYDHWAFLSWMSLYPTDNITYKIICKDGLIIKEHMIFDDQRGLYSTYAEKNDNDQITEYTISCDEWTDPYTGFALVIGKP